MNYIHKDTSIHKSVKLHNNVTIMKNVSVGMTVVIGNNVVIYPKTEIGDYVQIQDNTIIGKSPVLSAISTKHKNKRSNLTIISDHVLIGALWTIYSGVIIGMPKGLHRY